MSDTKRIIECDEALFAQMCDDYGGWCLECGDEAYGVEPDAQRYRCESCGAWQVYGAEELLVMGRIEFTE